MYDVIIIGSGPAGLTAGIYASRAGLKTLIVAGARWGGQLMLTTLVENFPGFPDGIQGPDLMRAMRKQAEKHGVEIAEKEFTRLQSPGTTADGGQVDGVVKGSPFTVTAEDSTYEARAIIIATGAETVWLGVKGEKEKIGRGVSSCAPCDAPFFRNKRVVVVGGGDSAMEEALVLTNFAREVIIVHRRDSFRASKVMVDKVFANPKIQIIFDSVIEEILGKEHVEGVRIRSKLKDQRSKLQIKTQNQEKEISPEDLGGKELQTTNSELIWELPTDGVFVAIGHQPNSKVFSSTGRSASGGEGIDVDEMGFIKVKDHYRTNVEGVFVAGDVHDAEYKQAVTAAGFGCAAALEVQKWLESV